MKKSIKKGFSFGLTSGIITTLGLIVGLYSLTESKLAILGGILVIAIADALSDAIAIHVSEEAENRHSEKEIWESTFATFFSKFVFALSFAVLILLFSLGTAVIISIAWGIFLMTTLSYFIGKTNGNVPYKVILEHLVIIIFVVAVTYYVGKGVRILG